MKFSSCEKRKFLSRVYASGSGIEIAPLHSAWPLHEGMHVKYVDRYSREELIAQYPELDKDSIATTDSIDDARKLVSVISSSQCFILNSHVLEHSDNPLLTLERWLEVLKVGGTILGAVPNKIHTFDRDRPLTLFRELALAYEGSLIFKMNALHTWYYHVGKLRGEDLERAVKNAMEKDLHVHFPVWDIGAFSDFLAGGHSILRFGYQLEFLQESGGEILFVLRRTRS